MNDIQKAIDLIKKLNDDKHILIAREETGNKKLRSSGLTKQ